MYVVNGSSALNLNRTAHGIHRRRIDNLFCVNNLLWERLVLHRQDSADLGAVYFNLVRNQVTNFTFTTGRALFLFPVKVCDRIIRQAGVPVLFDIHPSCRNGEMDCAILFPQLRDQCYHVVNFLLCSFAGLFEGIIIPDNKVHFAFWQAVSSGVFNRIYNRHTLSDKDIRLCLDIIVVFVAVVDVILLDDLVGWHLLFAVIIDVHNAFVVNGCVLSDSAALEVHFVLLPDPRCFLVQQFTYTFSLVPELPVFEVLAGIVHRIQIVMDNAVLVLYDRLDEVLLYRFHIAELGVFPLVPVVHPVISVCINVNTSQSVIITAVLIKLPGRRFSYLFSVHVSPP